MTPLSRWASLRVRVMRRILSAVLAASLVVPLTAAAQAGSPGVPWSGEPRLTVELPQDFNPHPASFRDQAEEAAYAQVVVRNGRSYVPAPVVGFDAAADLAVVQIPAGLLPPLRFARPDAIEVGEDVVAIGYALSLPGKPTVTKGVVSAVGRTLSKD